MTLPLTPVAPGTGVAPAPTVSVVVPLADGGDAFAVCLSRLAALDPPPHEVLVVSDGATDGSAERAIAWGARVIRRAERRGPATARNDGWRSATGDIVLFVDADVALRPDAIARVRQALADPALAGVIGSYDDTPASPDFLSQYKNLAHRFVHQSTPADTFTFWAACGGIRRGVLAEVGGFDERYGSASIEDIELGYRLRRHGHRVRVDRRLEVTHLKRWTLGRLIDTEIRCRAVPWSELLLREGFDDGLNLRVRARAAVVLVWLLLAALALSPFSTVAAWSALAGGGLLLALDVELWTYFARLRGPWFALATVPVHWLHYAYSGAVFGAVVVRQRRWPGTSSSRIRETA